MRASRATAAVVFALWAALLVVVMVGLLLSPGGLAGAPDATGLPVARLFRLGGNAIYVALLASLLATVWALPIAAAAALAHGGRGRALISMVALLPLFIAPPVMAVVAVRLFGAQGYLTDWTYRALDQLGGAPTAAGERTAPIFSLTGTGVVLAWLLFPVVYLAQLVALLRIEKATLEAARLEAGDFRVLLRLCLPASIPGIIPGAAAIFLLAATEFGIPESLRAQPVLVTEVYQQFGVYYDADAALKVALVLCAFALAVLGAVLWLFARHFPAEALLDPHMAGEQRSPISPRTRRVLVAIAWIAALLPVAGIVLVLWNTLDGGSGRITELRVVWELAHEELLLSLRLATITGLLSAATGLLLGSALSGSENPIRWRLLLLAGFILPGVVVAVGLKMLMNQPSSRFPLGLADALASLDQTMVPLLLAYVIRFSPIVALLVEFALRRVPRELREVQQLESRSLLAAWRSWGWPALLPAMAAGWIITFALTLGEAGAAVLLIPPGTTTLSVRLLTLMHFAPDHQVSALSILTVGPAVLAVPLVWLLMRRIYRENP